MDSTNLTNILIILLFVMLTLLLILGGVYIIILFKNKKIKDQNQQKNSSETPITSANKKEITLRSYTKDSIFNFMEFDKIEDNMIIQKNGNRYIMIVDCQGINYDLMSDVEKTSVEEGFLMFLNTLRHPIQIYVQTRTVNLENSISTYKERVKEFENKLNRMNIQFTEMQKNGQYTQEQLDRSKFEITKQRNLLEYGKDVIYNTEKMSLNKNVLNKKYYVVISYYPEEASNNELDKEEIRNIAFSELYTRAQSIRTTLSVCNINSKIMNSNELVDLLYTAYNRDEAEVYGIEKAVQAGYEDLYSTAQNVLDKKMKALDKEIEQKALQKAQDAVEAVRTDTEKQIMEMENNLDSLIEQMAEKIIEENKQYIGKEIAEEAKKKISKKKNTKEGGKENVKEETKTTTRRRVKTA